MDEADITQARAELEESALRLANIRPPGPVATGRCLYCDEILDDTQRFCGAECRDGWESEARRLRK